MGEYRTSEGRKSGTAEEEEEGGEEGGGIYIRMSKIYTEKRTRRKKMERNRPELAGRREGRERRLLESMPRRPRCRGLGGRQENDYHCSGDGRA